MSASLQPWLDRGAALPPAGLYPRARSEKGVDGFAAVTGSAVEMFQADGYLRVRGAFAAEEVQSPLAALSELIQEPRGFSGIQFEAGAAARWDSLAPENRQDWVRKLWRFVDHLPTLQALASGAALRGALRRLMGDEPELFQDMALYKPPGVGREKPWHQDAAYFNLPDGVCVIGAWIALDDADVENGCMCVAPGSHRDGPALHFQRRDWQICDRDAPADRAVALPMASGDCLLFHGLLLHGTPPNHSLRRRRAVQFHYKPASAAWTEEAERLARFGGEGQGVEC